jgi:cytidylate kinase
VFPVIIFAVVAIPVLLIAFVTVRKRTVAGEHPEPEDAASRAEVEREFDEAERYQEKWREEQHRGHPDEDEPPSA